MLRPSYTVQFGKDLKLMVRRGKPMGPFKEIVNRLVAGQALEARHRSHKLTGNHKDRWECHIQPDWLLIYKVSPPDIIFERMGTHSDLFE